MVRFFIISDDLTGASDSGGQLVRYGMNVKIVLQPDSKSWNNNGSIVINTDSRSSVPEDAYERIKTVCKKLRNQHFDVVYKKIDSTMRGNIGVELNAMYDVFNPDFIVISPGYPENGRKVKDGIHYLNGVKLQDSELANDPKTPVSNSNILHLLENQTGKTIMHLSSKDLNKGQKHITNKLKEYKSKGIHYITVDSTEENDFLKLIKFVDQTGYDVIWSGSAGLINRLPQYFGKSENNEDIKIPVNQKPVLFVVGSVSTTGREQLNYLLTSTDTVPIEINSAKVIRSFKTRQTELNQAVTEAKTAINHGKNIALFTSNDVHTTMNTGEKTHLNAVEISNLISESLGEIAFNLIKDHKLSRLFLTGGDTAQQVFSYLKVKEYNLIGEIEIGIPIGKFNGEHEIISITKAGNFGSKSVMKKALDKLNGKQILELNN